MPLYFKICKPLYTNNIALYYLCAEHQQLEM